MAPFAGEGRTANHLVDEESQGGAGPLAGEAIAGTGDHDAGSAAFGSFDPTRVVAFYDVPTLVLTDRATLAMSSPAELVGSFAQVMAMYGEHGVAGARPRVTALAPLTDSLVSAQVNWTYVDRAGHKLYDCDYVYLIRARGTTPRIEVIISLNEAQRSRT